jgi:hypothetical protein
MSEQDEFAGSELVALLPMRWTPLGDSGIEVLAGPARGPSIPLRYRTRDASEATADATAPARRTSGKKGAGN